jgi:hypothetical protein
MKSLRDYINLIDSVQELSESHAQFPDEHSKPMPGIKRYDGLDNSNPYKMWRFMVATAGHPDAEYPMSKESPTGQKMASLAYTQADQDILDSTSKAMGETGKELSNMDSTEPDLVNKISPVRSFEGYPR